MYLYLFIYFKKSFISASHVSAQVCQTDSHLNGFLLQLNEQEAKLNTLPPFALFCFCRTQAVLTVISWSSLLKKGRRGVIILFVCCFLLKVIQHDRSKKLLHGFVENKLCSDWSLMIWLFLYSRPLL